MPCTTVPSVLVVKPRSLKPIPPSLYVSAVDQVWPPSLDRKSQLAPEAVASARVPDDVAASTPLAPPVGALPTTVATPFSVRTMDFSELPAAPGPVHSEYKTVELGATIEAR